MPQCLTCSCGEVPVRGDKVESLAKIVNIEIEISEAAILFCDCTHFSVHLSTDAHSAHGLMVESMKDLINLLGVMEETGNRPFQLRVELGRETAADIGAVEIPTCIHVS